ncbi:type III secretion system effector XopAV [Xanthomonas axonopodis]|uniref:type III secretion system effector XopAV n=1 Tax=Xanthomonas axonopodis TaxID=53413 RepID=UPI001F14E0E1|nr:type III secretion system effector XopAV [Xanthomonas axonopodis]
MRSAALPSMSPTVRRQEIDLESGLAEIELGNTSSPHSDEQINTQLQGLPQQPARRASTRTTRQRVAGHVSTVAGVGATLTGLASIPPPVVAFFGYINEKDQLGKYAGIATLAGIATTCALSTVQRLAHAYAYGYNIRSRAHALGTTQDCMKRAVDIVTMPDEHDRAEHPMNEHESNQLAEDLLRLARWEPSNLEPGLWQAASGVGDDAGALVDRLLAFRRSDTAPASAASSSGA